MIRKGVYDRAHYIYIYIIYIYIYIINSIREYRL